jgi:hypothetical protein
MAKGILQGLGILVIISIFILIVVKVFMGVDGFEDIKTQDDIPKGESLLNLCPSNNILVNQVMRSGNDPRDTRYNWACYPNGTTKVNRIFQNDNHYISILGPKGSTVKLMDNTGNVVGTLNDNVLDANAEFAAAGKIGKSFSNLKFSSIQVTLPAALVNRDPTCPTGRYSSITGQPCSGPANMKTGDAFDRPAVNAQLAAGRDSGTRLNKGPILDAKVAPAIIKVNSLDLKTSDNSSKMPIRNTRYQLYDEDDDDSTCLDDISGVEPDCDCQDSAPANVNLYY